MGGARPVERPWDEKEVLCVEKRESFSSRLGFLLISAGCAIGLGNVWRFPYITGKYGGAAFVLVYLLFLVIMSPRAADGTCTAGSVLRATIC